MTEISAELGRNIKRLRKAQGMSQLELERRLASNPGAVSRWELGHNAPNAYYLWKLSQVFGCKVDDLYGGEDA